MIHRLTENERKEQFKQQLRDDANRVVAAFLSEPQYDAVRQEYALYFDEIKAAIDVVLYLTSLLNLKIKAGSSTEQHLKDVCNG